MLDGSTHTLRTLGILCIAPLELTHICSRSPNDHTPLSSDLAEHGVMVGSGYAKRSVDAHFSSALRVVVHNMVTDEGIDHALNVARRVLG